MGPVLAGPVAQQLLAFHVIDVEAAVLIQAVAAGESALGQAEGAGVPEVQAVQALTARDVGMAAQDDRARGKTRQRRVLRQTVAVAGEDAQGVGQAFSETAKGVSMMSTSASQLPRTAVTGQGRWFRRSSSSSTERVS